MELEQAIVEAWRIAATDLDISMGTGGVLTDDDGEAHRYAVHVKDFGGPNGTICSVASNDVDAVLQRLADEAGYFYSALGESYGAYDRELFVATLDDWQWFGSGEPLLGTPGRPGVNKPALDAKDGDAALRQCSGMSPERGLLGSYVHDT
jgi:hypothetical protein